MKLQLCIFKYLVTKEEGRGKEWDRSKGGTLKNQKYEQNTIMKSLRKGDLKH